MENGRLNFYKFVDSLINYRSLKINAYKYSYIIVKPNGARHFKTYVNELEKNGFDVIEYYAIVDYETINMKLHTDPAVQKYRIPVNKMFKDCFGNYAVLEFYYFCFIFFKSYILQSSLQLTSCIFN